VSRVFSYNKQDVDNKRKLSNSKVNKNKVVTMLVKQVKDVKEKVKK